MASDHPELRVEAPDVTLRCDDPVEEKSVDSPSSLPPANLDATTAAAAQGEAENDRKTFAPDRQQRVGDFLSRWKDAMFWVLALITTVVIAGSLYAQREADETLFQQYVNNAQMADYISEYKKGAALWLKAISVAEKLNDSPKLIANLHVKAADDYRFSGSNRLGQFNRLSQSECRKALALYERTRSPNFFEMVTTAEKLYDTASRGDVYIDHQRFPWLCRNSYQDYNAYKIALSLHDNAAAINHYINYLYGVTRFDSEMPSEVLHLTSLVGKQHLLDKLRLCHELVYVNTDPSIAIAAQALLNKFITEELQINPSSLSDRIKLAEEAEQRNELHGAIVEYMSCAALKSDPEVQKKLLSLRLKSGAMDPINKEDVATSIEMLNLLKQLHAKAFGSDSPQVAQCNARLGTVYLLENRLAEAEVFFKEALRQLDSSVPITALYNRVDVCTFLGDIYTKQGRFEEGKNSYEKALAHDSKHEIGSARPFQQKSILEHLAYLYVQSGNLEAASQTISDAARKDSVYHDPYVSRSVPNDIDISLP